MNKENKLIFFFKNNSGFSLFDLTELSQTSIKSNIAFTDDRDQYNL